MMLALVLGPGSSFAAAQESAPPSAEPTAAGEPTTGGAFEPAGLLAQPRSNHHALPLADGRVLIAGGVDPDGSRVAELEVWDPATSTFGAAGQLTMVGEEGRAGAISTTAEPGQLSYADGETPRSEDSGEPER